MAGYYFTYTEPAITKTVTLDQMLWSIRLSPNTVVPNLGPPDVLRLQLPEAFTTTSADQDFWELKSKNIWRPKVGDHWFTGFSRLHHVQNAVTKESEIWSHIWGTFRTHFSVIQVVTDTGPYYGEKELLKMNWRQCSFTFRRVVQYQTHPLHGQQPPRSLVLNLGLLRSFGLQLPEAFTISSAGWGFWDLQFKSIRVTKVKNHCPSWHGHPKQRSCSLFIYSRAYKEQCNWSWKHVNVAERDSVFHRL